MTDPKLLANLRTYQRKWPINRAAVRNYLQRIWKHVGSSRQSEVTVVFLNDAQMRRYNRQYRKKDSSTDILSFPVNDLLDGRHYLGDMLISLDRTSDQAAEKGHSMKRELETLLLHGMLHLQGYDHETDNGQMNRLEGRLRRILIDSSQRSTKGGKGTRGQGNRDA